MSEEIQKDDMYLKGDLGTVRIASTDKIYEIKKVYSEVNSVTLTLNSNNCKFLQITEYADFEIIEPLK